MATAEQQRLDDDAAGWRRWGPYLAERAWGTVREDYSADGDAWAWFPHDHARSRVYRWNEDGLAGVCDDHQFLCLSLALWNGVDPILKERAFGLSGPEGNHGEDAKDYWWFVDSTPTHAWMRWRYFYPQRRFPYEQLVEVNGQRGRSEPEFELLDTGVFDDGYWDVTVDVAKASPEDMCVRVTARNAGPAPATLHVLPTLWLRNTWRWGHDDRRAQLRSDAMRPGVVVEEGHTFIGDRVLCGNGQGELLFCENETNVARIYGATDSPPFPKDGINDHVVHGTPTVNPAMVGTKAALWYRPTVAPGATFECRLRLAPFTGHAPDLGTEWERTMTVRQAEADEWHASLIEDVPGIDEATAAFEAHDYHLAHQAASRMFWSIYCDRYLEMIKDRADQASAQWTLRESFRVLLGLFAPFAPFLTEHLYQRFYRPYEEAVSLHLTRWPAADPRWRSDRSAVDQLAVILDATRVLRSGLRLGNSARLSQLIVQAHDENAAALLDQIAEPLRVAARADAVLRGPAEHPSGVAGITVGIVA